MMDLKKEMMESQVAAHKADDRVKEADSIKAEA